MNAPIIPTNLATDETYTYALRLERWTVYQTIYLLHGLDPFNYTNDDFKNGMFKVKGIGFEHDYDYARSIIEQGIASGSIDSHCPYAGLPFEEDNEIYLNSIPILYWVSKKGAALAEPFRSHIAGQWESPKPNDYFFNFFQVDKIDGKNKEKTLLELLIFEELKRDPELCFASFAKTNSFLLFSAFANASKERVEDAIRNVRLTCGQSRKSGRPKSSSSQVSLVE